MKRFFIQVSAILMLFAIVGCRDYFDINANPNRSTSAEPAFLFSASMTAYSNTRAIETGPSAGSWSQIWAPGTFGVFVNPGRYVISPFTNGNTWRTVYTGLQKNLDQAIQIARRDVVVDNNAIAQCKIMSAHGYLFASSIWGDIPFSEAIDTSIVAPKFDPQEDVMNGCIALLDEALDSMDVTSELGIKAPNDFVYAGNMEQWAKFARSLKFRTMLTMSDALGGANGDEMISMIREGGMISSQADNAFVPYNNSPIEQNPVWRILDTYTGRDNIVYFGSEALIEPMQDLNDPRVDIFFTPGPGADGELQPNGPGEAGNPQTSARITWFNDNGTPSNGIIRPDQPDLFFTYAEQMLLEAEVEFRFGDKATADQRYRDGIRASCEYYEVSAAQIDAYLASLPDLNTLSEQEALRSIYIQQWIEYFERTIEAWTNWRRTEWPELSDPTNSPISGIIRRIQYPPLEVTSNPSIPNQKNLDDKMWFDQ